jgi:signal transduction histidine kinase/ligand-binding sensor domain-containing protein
VRTVKRAHAQDVVALGWMLAFCPVALALNPSLDINQYAHSGWTVRDGFFKNAIHSIAQTPDGYIWLGTETGLLRFDGVRAVPWMPPVGERLPGKVIVRLLVARDGRLWIGSRPGLSSWKDGKFTHYPELAQQVVLALLEDRQGTLWAGTTGSPAGRLCAVNNLAVHCYGEDGTLGGGVNSLLEYKGNLWAGSTTGLWLWKPGPAKSYPIPGPAASIPALIEGDNGALWIAMRGGINHFDDDKIQPHPLWEGQFNPYALLRDRDGGIWIGTFGQGLLHVHQGRTDHFGTADGLSSDTIAALFEDREGNIWTASNDGLDRFRELAATTISSKQGLSSDRIWSVLADRDGSVWLGSSDGLNQWKNGQITIYRKPGSTMPLRPNQGLAVRQIIDNGLPDNLVQSLFQDGRGRLWVSTLQGVAYFENNKFIPVPSTLHGNTYSIAEDMSGNLWINQQSTLLRLLGGQVVEQIPWSKLGSQGVPTALATDGGEGGLWLGFLGGGLSNYGVGRIHTVLPSTEGSTEGWVKQLQVNPDRTLWAATTSGLRRVKDDRVETLNNRNGLPCDGVHWMTEDNEHSLWLYLECGLARITSGEMRAWVADPAHIVTNSILDNSDGVRILGASGGYGPRGAKSNDGKLWFVNGGNGVTVLDPAHLAINNLAPLLHIEQVIADNKKLDPTAGMRLPALVHDVSIDYTALSFAAPEKVRFRYKLEGQDRDWTEVVNRRQVHYSNLGPRSYRFRVTACNNSGVWNEAGATLDFSVAPAYYQTPWFLASCTGGFLVLFWALYRMRLHQIAHEFNMRMEERVGERTRIGRELHDTLLQSFQGLMLRFQVIDSLLPSRPDEAKEALQTALDRADRAIVESRDAVHDLRTNTTNSNDLSEVVQALGNELATQDSAAFSFVVEGAARNLHPIVRDEIYRIAREAMRNAFRHAQARIIEAELTYGDRLLRLRIRDDGCGIDPRILEKGRGGHYGLPGMRERADRIGAKLDVWSGSGTGTEIDLSVPGAVAYGTSPGRIRFWQFRRKAEGHE